MPGWAFSECPGVYLRSPGDRRDDGTPQHWARTVTIDGVRTPFEAAWWAHYQHHRGHSLGDPPPPKLDQAVRLVEGELRAQRAHELEEQRKKAEDERLRAQHSGADTVVVKR